MTRAEMNQLIDSRRMAARVLALDFKNLVEDMSYEVTDFILEDEMRQTARIFALEVCLARIKKIAESPPGDSGGDKYAILKEIQRVGL